jgi:pimeloyl-ACP methyl ester carboxylesterase
VLLGHSYGGMVVTGAFDRLPAGSVRRLVYWSAYVPNDGESLVDITPAPFSQLWDQIVQPDGGVPMVYELFRDALINDGDEAIARAAHASLNAHPYQAFKEKIKLTKNPIDFAVGKSYLHCQEDCAYPTSLGGWHPKFSDRLGLFRFVSMPGSHEVCFSNPRLLAEKIIVAGRD